ncbi:MAG: phosphate ABC transporter substrate-binding protein [Nitrospirota bacterium]
MKWYMKILIIINIWLFFAGNVWSQEVIQVKGSDTMVILAQKWAELYMRTHPDVTIQVTGGGSGTGIAALLNGTTDIADASRPMKKKEELDFIKRFKKRPVRYKVALDGVAIYLNEKNPVSSLTIDDLNKIYRGKTTNWKDVGGVDARIILYGRENSSGTYSYIKEHVLDKKDFASTTQTLPGTAAIINAVARDKFGIGYGGIGYAKGIKVISVAKYSLSKPIAPDMDKVISGQYPISRYLNLYIRPDLDKGAVHKYIEWILSDEGQRIVKDTGYYPLPE